MDFFSLVFSYHWARHRPLCFQLFFASKCKGLWYLMHRITLHPSQCIKRAPCFFFFPVIKIWIWKHGSHHFSLLIWFGRWCKFVYIWYRKAPFSWTGDIYHWPLQYWVKYWSSISFFTYKKLSYQKILTIQKAIYCCIATCPIRVLIHTGKKTCLA